MYIKKLLLSTLLLSGLVNAESSIGLDINNEDVEIIGSYDLSSDIGYNVGGTSFSIDGSYLHSEDDDLINIGFSGESALEAAPGLIFGFGLKTAFSDDFIALPILGKIKYILPLDSDIPTSSLLLSYAYAPSVLTFSDGETYSDFRAEAGIEVISSMHIFAGYRNIDTNYEYGDYKLNDSFYGGFKMSF